MGADRGTSFAAYQGQAHTSKGTRGFGYECLSFKFLFLQIEGRKIRVPHEVSIQSITISLLVYNIYRYYDK